MAANMEMITGTMEQMNALRQEGYHDVVIHVKKEKFYCHRHLIAAACPTLKPMLLKENWQSDTPRLKNVDSQLFKLIVEYVYSGVINITVGNAFRLLKLADYLGMECLMKNCIAFLKSSCPQKDLLEAYEFADHLKEMDLIDILLMHIARRLGIWRFNKKLLSFSFESTESVLKKLIKVIEKEGDSYLVCCETIVASTTIRGTCNICRRAFKGPLGSHKTGIPLFVLNWIKEDVAKRIDHFSVLCCYGGSLYKLYIGAFNEFFQHFRKELTGNIEERSNMSDGTALLHILKNDEIRTLSKSNDSDTWNVSNIFTLSASILRTAAKAEAIFYLSYNSADGKNKFWSVRDLSNTLRCPPLIVANYKLTTTNDIIYLYQYNFFINSHPEITNVCSYVEGKDKWFCEPCAPKSLYNSYFVSSKNTVYLVGGTSKPEWKYPSDKFIQRYDPRTEKWDVIPSDAEVDLLLNGAACMYDNKIYICSNVEPVGDGAGVDENKFNLKFYQFDTRLNKWKVEDVNVENQFKPTVLIPLGNQLRMFSKNLKDGNMIYDVTNNVWNKQKLVLDTFENVDKYEVMDGSVVKNF